MFAVRNVAVEGSSPRESQLVERALGGFSGTSLLKIDGAAIEARLEKLPHVHLLAYDRAYPNELRVRVSVERAAAVLRRGSDRWLVSSAGRVLRPLRRPLRRPLPVVWADRALEPVVGVRLRASEAARAVSALTAISAADPVLARRVWYVKPGAEGVVVVLRNRVELRLGSGRDLPLKLAVTRRVLAVLERERAAAAYVDVTVPQRPVAGATLNSKVEP